MSTCPICLELITQSDYVTSCCGASLCQDCYQAASDQAVSVTCDHCHHRIQPINGQLVLAKYYNQQIQLADQLMTKQLANLTASLAKVEDSLAKLAANLTVLTTTGPLVQLHDCLELDKVSAWYHSRYKNLSLCQDQLQLTIKLIQTRLNQLSHQPQAAIILTVLPSWLQPSQNNLSPDISVQPTVWWKDGYWPDWRLIEVPSGTFQYGLMDSIWAVGKAQLVTLDGCARVGIAVYHSIANQLTVHSLASGPRSLGPVELAFTIPRPPDHPQAKLRYFNMVEILNGRYCLNVRYSNGTDFLAEQSVYYLDSTGQIIKAFSLALYLGYPGVIPDICYYHGPDGSEDYLIYLLAQTLLVFNLTTVTTVTPLVEPSVVQLPHYGSADILSQYDQVISIQFENNPHIHDYCLHSLISGRLNLLTTRASIQSPLGSRPNYFKAEIILPNGKMWLDEQHRYWYRDENNQLQLLLAEDKTVRTAIAAKDGRLIILV